MSFQVAGIKFYFGAPPELDPREKEAMELKNAARHKEARTKMLPVIRASGYSPELIAKTLSEVFQSASQGSHERFTAEKIGNNPHQPSQKWMLTNKVTNQSAILSEEILQDITEHLNFNKDYPLLVGVLEIPKEPSIV